MGRVIRFNEAASGIIYLDNGELLFLADNPNCGPNVDDLEYVYDFEYAQRKLTLHIIACCPSNSTFGDLWNIPVDYKGNDNYLIAHPLVDDIPVIIIDGTDWGQIIAFNALIFICIIGGICIFFIYKKRQNDKVIDNLNQLISKQQKKIAN